MQIPYDLEFIENRPNVTARTLTLHGSVWGGAPSTGKQDAFGALLAWVHRMLRRLESPQR